jgi:hypothetical protein
MFDTSSYFLNILKDEELWKVKRAATDLGTVQIKDITIKIDLDGIL